MLIILYLCLLFKKYFEIITDSVIDGLRSLVYSKELENNYYKCHCHCLTSTKLHTFFFSVIYQIHQGK